MSAGPDRAPGPDVAADAEPTPVTAGPPTRVDPTSEDAREGGATDHVSTDTGPTGPGSAGPGSAAPEPAGPGSAGDASTGTGPTGDAPADAGAIRAKGAGPGPTGEQAAATPAPITPDPPPGVRRYARDGAAVTYEVALCRHAAECVRGLPQVFDTTKRPWIQPQHASVDELERVVALCPTRALKLERDPAIPGPAGG